MTEDRKSAPDGGSPHEHVDRLMSELERIVADQPSLPAQAIENASPAAVRAAIVDARIEVAALLGAVGAVEALAITSIEAGDGDTATACLLIGEQLQEGALLAKQTFDELLAEYGSGGLAAEFLTDDSLHAR